MASRNSKALSAALLLWIIPFAACASTCGNSSGKATEGMSVDHYLFDAALRLRWAVVIDCSHPERPATLIPSSAVSATPAQSTPEMNSSGRTVIRANDGAHQADRVTSRNSPVMIAGSDVEIRKDGPVNIQLAGIAMQSAPLGAVLMVRPAAGGVLLRGIARSAHLVELIGDSGRWREP
jgi:hypothetical protein